ncbi:MULTISPECIES: septal ring lytic transglycosylase RlpA family protein [Chryseobacterium]|uniref:Probable endolytic peptidoglycan transglycosylase RlpA n=1 Tax=Chryseobacterium indoltheticum TaxID=254 RepID=A0A381FPF4_9FLAO|nr:MULTISPECIES: septal ring lytic transglycosylase RlpA family protein [Chryseobacterium]AZA62785.1 septal ring lytic transglycosylase RlpA family protein [Chryseobacterium indoltheticum]AZA75207.1 septal ring lytic transglycosylase RlpA family protein [Chryseobacterium indoltheticum]MDQ8140999.1 septal ring lytic transglycosylase RlpA family protein [Chryseobacterium sp. CFS15]QQQ28072.1 septal ring lytic transglycosylase RlpA family protein [Chryseobacterium indoltheticum]SIR14548.1 rare li
MMKRFILVIIMMISTLGIYSFTNNTVDAKKTSYASYYHDKFNGRKTASGEVFDNSKLTAAHRTLPFGTEVKVTNLNNGKEVIVTINDRGPFHSSRALDMSRAAFDEIGNTDRGTIPVEYEIVD